MVTVTLHSNQHSNDNQKVGYAVAISLVLHLFVMAIYPHLSKMSLPATPDRLEIEMFSIKTLQPSISFPKETSIVEHFPTNTTEQKTKITPEVKDSSKPVMSNSNIQSEYRVTEQSQTIKQEIAPATPPLSSTTIPTPSVDSHQPSESQANKEPHTANAASAPVSNETDELTANDSDAWGDYGDQLSSLVNKSKQYPTIAIRRHLEGEATIIAQFVHGELSQVTLAESSKHPSLDEEAIRMVKKAISQLGIKETLRKKTFKITIPVSFKLE